MAVKLCHVLILLVCVRCEHSSYGHFRCSIFAHSTMHQLALLYPTSVELYFTNPEADSRQGELRSSMKFKARCPPLNYCWSINMLLAITDIEVDQLQLREWCLDVAPFGWLVKNNSLEATLIIQFSLVPVVNASHRQSTLALPSTARAEPSVEGLFLVSTRKCPDT